MSKSQSAQKRSWALPEGVDPKTVFFRHTRHGNDVRFTVCGIHNPATDTMQIGVCSHNTVKYGSMCRAEGRQRSYARAVESPIILYIGIQDAVDAFHKMFDIFSNQKMVEATKTESELLDDDMRIREAKRLAEAVKDRRRQQKKWNHELRMAEQKKRSREHYLKTRQQANQVEIPQPVEQNVRVA